MTSTKQQLLADEAAMLFGDPIPDAAAPSPVPPARVERHQARLKPLEQRLREKLAQIPKDEQAKGLHMNTIWSLCSGVQRSKPPAWQVGEALRQLGWTRQRIYSDGTEPSGTWWFPPEVSAADVKAARKRAKGLV